MPIYEYRCEKCGDFEEMQRITDSPLVRCPRCKRKVRRLISNTSFQLKGSGWYVTDYARSGGGAKGGDKKDSASEAPAKSESTSETKSETKSDTKTSTKTESKAPASGDSGSS
jgi:putative FmdB family regulatory protein